MIGWLIAIAVVTGLILFPIRLYAWYDKGGAVAYVRIGPWRKDLYPTEDKPQKNITETKKAKSHTVKKSAEKKGGSWKEFSNILSILPDLLGDLAGKLLIRKLEMKLILAGDDPCDLALNYGRAWALLGGIIPNLERIFRIKKRDLSVGCDFESDTTTIYARAELSLTVGRAVVLVARYLLRLVKNSMNKNTNEGGAET